jgi:hypothetical protein
MRPIHQRLAASVAAIAASLVLVSGAAAAGVTPSALHPDDRAFRGVGPVPAAEAVRPDDRADRTLPPATLYAGPLDRIGMLPDDRADRTLPRVALTTGQPGTRDGFDWQDAGLGAATALAVVVLAAGGAAGGRRRRRPADAMTRTAV